MYSTCVSSKLCEFITNQYLLLTNIWWRDLVQKHDQNQHTSPNIGYGLYTLRPLSLWQCLYLFLYQLGTPGVTNLDEFSEQKDNDNDKDKDNDSDN